MKDLINNAIGLEFQKLEQCKKGSGTLCQAMHSKK